ncbi:MAG: PAS/PAC sensor-containing diguanylate cyclase/phosphodiesterase [Rhodocyclaceae bacterium]|nr:MAG: PAS/PAC sensor-containing diguanylate cyclase/phosphodiesterase [Rhodocyclaceae bacterium]TND01328.1 MAG: PAS/PAC sensor-containing diguanylate cyclase/phosphodiesterase [Rhodocyclaceae bacterium]
MITDSPRLPDDIFRWSDGFAIGHGTVDEQHAKLIEILNRLARYHTSNVADEDLLRVFDELVSYTVYHFGTEEALMSQFRVAETHSLPHRRAHQAFIDQALAARQAAEKSPRDVTGQTLAYLTNWLIQHILGMDRRLGEEIRLAQARDGLPVTVETPPSDQRTTEVLLGAIDGLYQILGHNTNELLKANRLLQQELAKSKEAEQRLRVAATAFEAQEGITITGADGLILQVNKAFTAITGYSAEEVVGRNPRMLSSGRQDAAYYQAMWQSIKRTGSWQGEIWNRRKNGEAYPAWLSITAVFGDDGVATHYVATSTDIAPRKLAEDRIEHLAYYDQLTQLPNRRLMMDRLEQAATNCARRSRHGALMLIDLDNFKALNDTMGHAVGDSLLIEVAARLDTCVRDGDTVARLGGDEFVVIIGDIEGEELAAIKAERVAEKIQEKLGKSYVLDVTVDGEKTGECFHTCTSSIGIALFRDQSVSIDELLKRADTAMYQAKDSGRNTLRFFDPEMQAAVEARVALEKDMRKAITERQFVLYYQPQVDSSGRVTGAEALVRWNHPERGLIEPADFIPLAEETGLILPLGHWVLDKACRQLAAWAKSKATEHLILSVNVSARQFNLPSFVDDVLALVDANGVLPNKLKLELTESLMLESAKDIIARMTALKVRNIGFSIDDFGTGYSSLAYLKQLPLDQLKIDQSFVKDILTHPSDAAIAKTIVALANSLGLSVIAEGVETEGQRDFLVTHGCPTCQGYFFCRPVPIEEFEQYLIPA